MAALRIRQVLLVTVLVGILIGALGYVLVDAHRSAEHTLKDNFARRTSFAAKTTGELLAGSATQSAVILRQVLGGPPSTLRRGLARYARLGGLPTPQMTILDARGRIIATRGAAERPIDPVLLRALEGRPAISDLRQRAGGRTAMLVAMPYRTRYGLRVLIGEVDASILPGYINGYLRAGPAVPGSSGYLIDGSNRIVAASTQQAIGTRFSRHFGSNDHVVRATVPGTAWAVVFAAPRDALLDPVDGANERASIIVFSGFVLAILAAIALFVRTARRSAQLAASREREMAAATLAHERLHDALTHLPNRNLFSDRVRQALSAMRRSGGGIAIVFVDLDRFKVINDSLGHSHGDALLRAVADRLSHALRPDDTLSRFGGDEFVVLARGVDTERAAFRVAERILDTLAEPFELSPRTVRLSASAGIVLHRSCAGDADPAELLRAADVAMYRAKERGPGSLQLFDEDMHRRAVARLDTELALRDALERDELLVYYQPIVTLPDGTLFGFEALARWNRPGHGIVPPTEFIDLAEESELIVDIGAWVLRRALHDLAAWRRAGVIGDTCTLSVNLSTKQLFHAPIVQTVADALADSGVSPHDLCLEITESVMMEDAERAITVLLELKELGISLAVDDFGVGHSSLEQLGRMLPVDEIKLDRTFVSEMHRRRDHAIVTTVASLAGSLEMLAVAEGVETREQAVALADLGYPLAQGYLFGRPMPAEHVAAGGFSASPAVAR